MRTETGTVFRLEEYKPTSHLLHEVDLSFSLYPNATNVVSKMVFELRNQTSAGTALTLDGDGLELAGLFLNGRAMGADDYSITADGLTIRNLPSKGRFTLEIHTTINPEANTQLMGLYRSSGVYCTQCEAEGFRRITYFLDRPDVLATYTVRVEGPQDECPLLLSNGNRIDEGVLDGGRHFAVWHDPHPKPCYLFALVAGNLGLLADTFKTMSGREVALEIYVEHGKEARAAYAMDALKRSMKWDEDAFGREYDLSVFMLVAVSDFNMGAMENKGLNIFNDKYVLADPKTATDQDYANIEAIVAHEYFHNWTGNRITCRDWFQLCLKEGLTVFRDHEFSADMRERGVKRIAEVRLLRSQQFPEDAGPLAHPVRPRHYKEINNFYTATVYEKGSEVVRMLRTILGEEKFRAGIDLYFDRHDGDAATIEDWVRCFEDATGEDLSQFALWYEQPGTPNIAFATDYDTDSRTFTVSATQTLKAPIAGSGTRAMHVPITFNLLAKDGEALSPTQISGGRVDDGVMHLTKASEDFVFGEIDQEPILSTLLGFSAPVTSLPRPDRSHLLFIAQNETDDFARWDALNSLMTRHISAAVLSDDEAADGEEVFDAILDTACDDRFGQAFRALCLTLPSEQDIGREIQNDINPDAIFRAVQSAYESLSTRGAARLGRLYNSIDTSGEFSASSKEAGKRALKNRLLTLLCYAADETELAAERFRSANNMTEQLHALMLLVHLDGETGPEAVSEFENTFGTDPVVMDKWFTVQATKPGSGALHNVQQLANHSRFSWDNPNRVRALLGAFSAGNASGFNRQDGEGYNYLCAKCAQIDAKNPQLAARLLTAMRSWKSLEKHRRNKALAALTELDSKPRKSRDLSEMVERMIR
ncbi:MAG: aminopeptidase N [Pseudomonadota bacterium]